MNLFIDLLLKGVHLIERHKDWFASMTGLITAAAALYALSTWRRQLRGKDRYKAARRIRRALYVLKALIEDRGAVARLVAIRDASAPQLHRQHYEQLFAQHLHAMRQAMEALHLEVFEASVLVRSKNFDRILNPIRGTILQIEAASMAYELHLASGNTMMPQDVQRSVALLFDTDKAVTKGFDDGLRRNIEFIESAVALDLWT